MRIQDNHMYHGAALTQIAEHSLFTAINAFKEGDHISRSSFRINDDIGVYLKYGGKPNSSFDEYQFTFRAEHIEELDRISEVVSKVFLALVCIKDREICCLPLPDFRDLIGRRRRNRGSEEDQYVILVTCPPRSKFRVYKPKQEERKATKE